MIATFKYNLLTDYLKRENEKRKNKREKGRESNRKHARMDK